MSRYSGVVLDYYDDRGATLKAKFPAAENLPEVIKTASIQNVESLPDESFALLAVDEGRFLRKFACSDAGTTAMSVIYFMEHGDKLTKEAQTVAATNLVAACMEHGLLPPKALTKLAEFDKESGIFGRIFGAKQEIADTAKNVGANLSEGALDTLFHQGPKLGPASEILGRNVGIGATDYLKKELPGIVEHASGGAVNRFNQELAKIKQWGGAQARQLAMGGGLGGAMGALAAGPSADERKGGALAGIAGGMLGSMVAPAISKRVGTIGRLGGAAVGGALGGYLSGGAKRIVNLAGGQPMTQVNYPRPVSNEDYMMVDPATGSQMFPIDSYDRVKQAEAYLKENHRVLSPDVRRQCCVKLAAKCELIGYPLDEKIKEAGSKSFAPVGQVRASVELRKMACGDQEFLQDIFDKHASLGPELYSECLRRFDIENGIDHLWGRAIPDPWESTFGMRKTAEVVWAEGLDRVTDDELANLAENHSTKLHDKFGSSFAKEFVKDPVSIFSSMPSPEKKILARLAADCASSGSSEGTL